MSGIPRYLLRWVNPTSIRSRLTPQANALIVGSAPAAADLQEANLSGLKTVAINNAWRILNSADYFVFPDDFPCERRPPRTMRGTQIANIAYMPAMNSAGGIILCGATMAFATGYWATHSLKGNVIGFYACDMIYQLGKTHFYGEGTADPLRKDVSLQSLEAKAARLFCWALAQGKLLVNCSQSEQSRLVFPKVALDNLKAFRFAPHLDWEVVLDWARKGWALESRAPFDAMLEEYWLLVDTLEKEQFIADVDHHWLEAVPLIRNAWGSRPS